MSRIGRRSAAAALSLVGAAAVLVGLEAGVPATAVIAAAQHHSVPKLTGYRQIMVYDSNIIYGSLNGQKTVTYTVNKAGDKQTVHYYGRDFLSYAGSDTRSYVLDLMALEEVRTPFDTGAYDGCGAFASKLQYDVQHDAGRGAHYRYIDAGKAGNVCLIYRDRFKVVAHATVRNWSGTSCTSKLQKGTGKARATGSDLVLQLEDTGPSGTSDTHVDVAVIHLPFYPNNSCTKKNITDVRDQLHQFDDRHGAAGHLILGDFNDNHAARNAALPSSSGYHVVKAVDPETHTACTHCFNGGHPDWVFEQGGSVSNNRLVPYIPGTPPSVKGTKHPAHTARAYSDHKGYVLTFTY